MTSRPLFFGLVLALAALAGTGYSAEPEKTVKVVVDFGDGSEKHFTQIPWKEEANVFSATAAASEHPHGFALQSRGSGATRFVFAIDDVKNEGNGRNWIFRVNDKLATRSCELVEVAPGDVILWRFQRYE
ncbi:DUF4430 domain-containing protein [Blastopirellula sp. JC732]|uniref:DUF4430 domain-containing protein n=1 Tax=Blastopirellula sediminis TaxID=2894196 RepID=A0A9X1MI49_9BACT|nr:DUF4430 domain-containing protein [Blastopirellula sediminis]MCC9609696.1 DUF4430 domain-containing protein [Blastopirellula sediminis]MCC9627528.1 DUF4430 domain-containing protein [Blastopirellula sediminis]